MEIKNTMTGRLFIVIITFRARFFHRISSIFTGCLTKSTSMSIYICNVSQALAKMHTRFYLSPRDDTTFHNESPVNLLSPFTNAISFSLFLIFLLPSFLFSATPVANSWYRLMKVFRAFWKKKRGNMHNLDGNCISFNRVGDGKNINNAWNEREREREGFRFIIRKIT